MLAGRVRAVTCSGTRAAEMALRLKYAGVDRDRTDDRLAHRAVVRRGRRRRGVAGRGCSRCPPTPRCSSCARRSRAAATPPSTGANDDGGLPHPARLRALPGADEHLRRPRQHPLPASAAASGAGSASSCAAAGPGERFDPAAHDLFYIGGGQDRDQAPVAADMVATKRDALAAAVDDGAVAARRLRRLPAARPQLRARRRARSAGPRPGRPAHGARARPAADRQRRDRGRPRRRAPRGPRRLREPRRPHLPRAAATPLGRVAQGPRQQRQRRPRGRAPRQPHRHLPARPAAAEERLARRRADGARTGARRYAGRARAARRRARTSRPRLRTRAAARSHGIGGRLRLRRRADAR